MPLTYAAHCVLLWLPCLTCLLTVGVRLFVRYKLRAFGLDDVLMTTSVVFYFVASTLGTAMSHEVEYVKKPNLPRYYRMAAVSSFFIYLCMLLGKASVSFLLLRALKMTSRVRKWAIYITLVLLGSITVLPLVGTITPSCKAPKSIWIVNYCVDPNILTAFNQTFNWYSAFFDIFYSFIPLTFIYGLQIPAPKKAFLAFSLSLGWTAAAFSILRAIIGYVWPGNADQQMVMTQLSTNLEPAFIILCGSLASLTPLFDYFTKGRPLAPRSANSAYRSAGTPRGAPKFTMERNGSLADDDSIVAAKA